MTHSILSKQNPRTIGSQIRKVGQRSTRHGCRRWRLRTGRYGSGGYGLGQPAYGQQQYGQYGGQPAFGAAGSVQEGARSLRAGASSNRSGGSSGAVSNASFRRRM